MDLVSDRLLHQTTINSSDKEKIKRIVPKGSNKIIEATVARLYIAYPEPHQWNYTGLSGAILLVDDLVGNTFWLKLVDISGNRGVLWDQELYIDFSYNQDRSFFHSFEIENCLVGLLFEDTGEASRFFKKVTAREKHGSKKTVQNKNAIALKKEQKDTIAAPGPRGDTSHNNQYNATSDQQRIRKTTHAIYYDGLPPPEWRSLYAELNAAGITESMIADNKEFIKDYIRQQGGPLVGLEPPIPRKLHRDNTSSIKTDHNPAREVRKKAPPPPPPSATASDSSSFKPSQNYSEHNHSSSSAQVQDSDDEPDDASSVTENSAPKVVHRLPPPITNTVHAVPPPPANIPSAPPFNNRPNLPAPPPRLPDSSGRPMPVPPPRSGNVPPPPPQRGPVPPVPPQRGPAPPPRGNFSAPAPTPPPPRRGMVPPPPPSRGSAMPPAPPSRMPQVQGNNQPTPPVRQSSIPPPLPSVSSPSNYSHPQQMAPSSSIPPPPAPPMPPVSFPSHTEAPAYSQQAPAYSQQAPAYSQQAPPPPPPPPLPPAVSFPTHNEPPSYPQQTGPSSAAAPPPPLPPGFPTSSQAPNAPPAPPAVVSAPVAASLPQMGGGGRDDLLASIRNAGGIGSLKKVDKSQLDRPSVILREGQQSNNRSSGATSAGPGAGGSLADAIQAALNSRKSKVSRSDDESDGEEW
ncbi:hypothetical protein WICPIJ_009285 [Wickerhamomyces pijperi]|uniref:WH1 domain-containing protein n=1 Tax=Wickerhamomyces pijperi TaxID=599730 RepID=A0A9P8PQC9_WICPI|nr:hypothetical protein WICPIJ_009285 [Wickerhamomyces pijperi]